MVHIKCELKVKKKTSLEDTTAANNENFHIVRQNMPSFYGNHGDNFFLWITESSLREACMRVAILVHHFNVLSNLYGQDITHKFEELALYVEK